MYRLDEASRNDLVAKSKRSEKGLERYKKRVKSRVASNVKEFNRIDMNQLFKDDIITIKILVHGETDDYTVTISYGGILEELNRLLKDSEIDLRYIIRALITAFNKNDIYVRCSCPDFQYRYGYYATVNKYNQGQPELIASKQTNPDDNLGSACKHVLLVLNNTSWLIKVASVIKNYIDYMQNNRAQQYADIIYPAIYKKKYEEPTQLSFDSNELQSDESTLDISNIEARKKGQFKPGNEFRIPKSSATRNQVSVEDITT